MPMYVGQRLYLAQDQRNDDNFRTSAIAGGWRENSGHQNVTRARNRVQLDRLA